MNIRKKLVLVALFILFFCSVSLANKSVFIISSHDSCLAEAFSIDGDEVSFQAMVDISTLNPGAGPVGVAVWPQKELIFLTYEDSPMIVWSSTKTLEKVGDLNTGVSNLAGIVVNTVNQKIYVIERGTANLYIYSYDSENNTLVYDSTHVLDYLYNAYGIALDETNDRLYVSNDTVTVRYYDYDYDTTTWVYRGPIDIYFNSQPRPAVGIAVDPARGYLYTGNFYGTGYNHTSLVRTPTAPPYTSIETDIGYPVIGIDVDKSTGLVYCTTHAYYNQYTSDFRVYNSSLTLLDIERNNDIESPSGVAVGGWYKSDNFNLIKDDGGVICVSPDDQFTYYIHYNANDADTSVVVTDTLPPEVDYISSFPEGQPNGHTVTWTFPSIEPGQPGTLQILVKLNCYADPGGTITNVVEMEGDNYYNKATLNTTKVCCYDGGPIIYVDKDATNGCNNGTSWDNAYIDLQKALARARRCPGATAIWVAAGTYKPTINPSASGATFELIDGVDMYGHFGGVDTYEDSPDDRDFTNVENTTTLDGQIGVNPSDAVQYVVTAKNFVDIEGTIVDGFTITGSYNGAGILIEDSPNSNLKIINCVVMRNNLLGIYCERSWTLINKTIFDGGNQSQFGISASLSDVEIYDSEVKNHTGPGIYVSYSGLFAESCSVKDNGDAGVTCKFNCDVEIKQSKICSNKAAGIYLEDSLGTTITNNWICDNLRFDPYSDYAGIYLNGPIFPALIRNNTVCKNEPYGIYLTSGREPEVINCILYYNTITQIYTGSGQPPLNYVTYSCVQGDPVYQGYRNINTPPSFLAAGDYHLTWESGCVDAGNSSSIPPEENDIDGNPRVAGTDVDIGGDEDYPHCNQQEYNDWVSLGKPNCWWGIYGNPQWPYQCDGDADNLTQGLQKFRVYTNDYNIMFSNWKKVITDPLLNPCADFDHKPQGVQKFRVYTNDFNILVNNWKKTDAELPGNCYRCESYQQSQGKTLNSQEIMKWLEQIWLDEEVQKLIDKDVLLKFMESLKEEL